MHVFLSSLITLRLFDFPSLQFFTLFQVLAIFFHYMIVFEYVLYRLCNKQKQLGSELSEV